MQADYIFSGLVLIVFDVMEQFLHAAAIITHNLFWLLLQYDIHFLPVGYFNIHFRRATLWLVHLQHCLKQSTVHRNTFTCNNTALHFINICFVMHCTGIKTFTHPWFAYYSTYSIIASLEKALFFLFLIRRRRSSAYFLH